jgi:ribosomal protein L31
MSKKTATTKIKSKHPRMTNVKVIFSNGESLTMPFATTDGKDTLYLQSDQLTHRAWNHGQARLETKGSRAQKFAKRFPQTME